jgi:hypothetical protein
MPEFRAFAVFQRFLIQISERFVHCADRASNFPLWNSVVRGPGFIAAGDVKRTHCHYGELASFR